MSMLDVASGGLEMPFLPLLAQAPGGVESSLGELGTLPIRILIGYLFVLLILGLVGWWKGGRGEEDYYLAGRGQGWLVSSVTIMATFFSSFALLGAPGMVYREGVLFALFSLNVPVAGLCVYLLGSRIWKVGRRFGYITPGDMVSDYYGSRVSLRVLVAVTSFLYVLPYVFMQIQAGGLLSEQMFPGENSFAVGASILAAITMIYIMVGGMRSVAWTDLIQGTLLILGMLVSGFAMLQTFGSPADFGRQVSETLPDAALTTPGTTGKWPWTLLLSVCLFSSSGSMVQPAQWMRFYSARNVKTLKRGALIFAVVLTSCFILGVMLIGLAGQILYPLTFSLSESLPDGSSRIEIPADLQPRFTVVPATESSPAELVHSWSGKEGRPISDEEVRQLQALDTLPSFQAAVASLQQKSRNEDVLAAPAPHPAIASFDSILVAVVSRQLPEQFGYFGAIVASLILVGIMAASMSTADSNLHALSAVATRDVYDQFVRPQASEAERVWVGRAIIAIATGIALLVVIFGERPEIRARYDIINMIAQMGLMAIAFSSQLLPMTIDMVYVQKGTGRGAAAGLTAGLLATYLVGPLFEMTVEALGSPAVLTGIMHPIQAVTRAVPMHGAVWGLIVNLPVFVLVSLVTRPPAAEKVQAYREILNVTRGASGAKP